MDRFWFGGTQLYKNAPSWVPTATISSNTPKQSCSSAPEDPGSPRQPGSFLQICTNPSPFPKRTFYRFAVRLQLNPAYIAFRPPVPLPACRDAPTGMGSRPGGGQLHANPSYLPGSRRGQGRAQSVAQARQTQRAGLEVLWAEGRGTLAGRSAPAHRTELPPRKVCSSTLRPCQLSLTPGRVCSGVPFLTGK